MSPKCKKDMRFVERKGTIDCFEWRCRVQSKENPHFVSRSVCQQFYQYFSDGMSPIEAIRFHENKFLLEDNFMGLANASINPTHNQIYYLHKCWRDANLGSSINPFDKLKEKVPFYESIGTTVKVHEDHLWAVLLVTRLMKRNHHLFSSKEIIFIDSTSSCEASSSTITILLSATKVGALPLVVMIHASQSIQNYINAFQLLKMNFPQCFGRQDVICMLTRKRTYWRLKEIF
ncbi:SWIM-type domain-containing protein [Trichonephila clavipes]|nr:SWIM-type domain-containing protein [Trichonephila clavipes]